MCVRMVMFLVLGRICPCTLDFYINYCSRREMSGSYHTICNNVLLLIGYLLLCVNYYYSFRMK